MPQVIIGRDLNLAPHQIQPMAWPLSNRTAHTTQLRVDSSLKIVLPEKPERVLRIESDIKKLKEIASAATPVTADDLYRIVTQYLPAPRYYIDVSKNQILDMIIRADESSVHDISSSEEAQALLDLLTELASLAHDRGLLKQVIWGTEEKSDIMKARDSFFNALPRADKRRLESTFKQTLPKMLAASRISLNDFLYLYTISLQKRVDKDKHSPTCPRNFPHSPVSLFLQRGYRGPFPFTRDVEHFRAAMHARLEAVPGNTVRHRAIRNYVSRADLALDDQDNTINDRLQKRISPLFNTNAEWKTVVDAIKTQKAKRGLYVLLQVMENREELLLLALTQLEKNLRITMALEMVVDLHHLGVEGYERAFQVTGFKNTLATPNLLIEHINGVFAEWRCASAFALSDDSQTVALPDEEDNDFIPDLKITCADGSVWLVENAILPHDPTLLETLHSRLVQRLRDYDKCIRRRKYRGLIIALRAQHQKNIQGVLDTVIRTSQLLALRGKIIFIESDSGIRRDILFKPTDHQKLPSDFPPLFPKDNYIGSPALSLQTFPHRVLPVRF